MASRKNWGAIRKLPSDRFQASYVGPDGRRHNAPDTFKTKTGASSWLATKRTEILEGTWEADEALGLKQEVGMADEINFEEYALLHIELQTNRKGELLRESTKALYRRTLKNNLKPFLSQSLTAITKPQVSEWYAKLVATGRKTSASKAYKLLSSVLKRAADEGKITKNPCSIRGAHGAATGKVVDIPSADEVATIANSIEPKFKTFVLVAAYGGFRFGELTELRRKDVFAVEKNGQVAYEFRVRRAVTYVNGSYVIDKPKSEKSSRNVPLSPALTALINDHLFSVVPDEDEALLFPASSGGHLPHHVFIKAWNKALKNAGVMREGITPHSLRHFAGTHYHLAGATLPELMDWLGDSSIAAVQRYLHVTDRASEIAGKMSISKEMFAN
jgi:integrase